MSTLLLLHNLSPPTPPPPPLKGKNNWPLLTVLVPSAFNIVKFNSQI